jgi:SAM-dependent methyltransferase
MAVDYQHVMGTDLAGRPVEHSVLALFAELCGTGGAVLDAGCGPGRVTAHLASLGLSASGLDLSPVMTDIAATAFPELSFRVGSLTSLDLPDESLDGLLAWYSLINLPAVARRDVLAELHRVLRPGGHLLVAFQVGDAPKHIEAPDGRRFGNGDVVALDFHRLSPEVIWAELQDVRFVRVASVVRAPVRDETLDQAYLIARRD